MSEKMTSQNKLTEFKSVPYNKPQNLQNTAYPEIVFCYIAQIFAYFILPHIVLYFIFCCGFLVTIVLHHAHKDAHLFCLYFFPCHVHYYLVFYFNSPADYFVLILAQKNYVLSFYRTFHRFVLF
jgi:hypothetical protein